MPRVTNLRKHKVAELLKLLEEGPSLSDIGLREPYTPERAMDGARLWLHSWVRPLVQQLVPELRKKK